MPQNFIACDCERELLLRPSLKEWLLEDHLAWFVLAMVEGMDLSAFYASCRGGGHGRAAHEPGMLLALLFYAYCKGAALLAGGRVRVRGGRRLPRDSGEPAFGSHDDRTVCQRHETALADLFGEVLGFCAQAGLVQVGVVAVDGTRVHANASQRAARDYEQIAREILQGRGGRSARGRAVWGERGDELSPELSSEQGRRGWLREGKRRFDEKRAGETKPIPRSRAERLWQSKRWLEEEL